ncbi:acryloyl-CoA reductase electron transfer subunit gamma [bacterium BMS3Bbin06]|nr:acryloyl-CoA reductase electron transfer subunit gamma [bacterium BMS3Abin08]GBE33737.1 acryloyl-CoA reductase electron transfer subunit gamma [bacterium BMS3Bbin06]HDO36146.1 electron transfer flavoprotein beta subunit/FixA family protein [Nitrospirota bacterium]HDY70582.1 electron transfer flavoprotein beta subunit/FixA family protein [Nitrospirota bacterium]
MKILVCIKQVPDTAEVRINPETNTLVRDGVPSIINPYDLNAIEAGLRIREDVGATVTAVSMGPPQAENALREAIAMGVDEVVLLTDRCFAGADTWATAYTLSKAAERIGFDIIICGKQAIDGDTAQVGPEMAEFLGIPHIAYVRAVEEITPDTIVVQRLMEEGYDVVQCPLPVLLTVVKELNEPRLPSLKGKMRAKKAEIKKLSGSDIGVEEENTGLKGSPTQVKNIFAPDLKKDRKVFSGTLEEQTAQLLEELRGLKCL